jgi:hypothetical protein
MNLNPGEAAILLIRRSDTDPRKYFVAVRRAKSQFHQETNDYIFGPFHVAAGEFGNAENFGVALNRVVAIVKKFGPAQSGAES